MVAQVHQERTDHNLETVGDFLQHGLVSGDDFKQAVLVVLKFSQLRLQEVNLVQVVNPHGRGGDRHRERDDPSHPPSAMLKYSFSPFPKHHWR